ncbi:MAG TPA: hypothetical protein VMT58_02770, partial [Candidatus Binataceae bacterium]|nr:hypothetical protein [Candidatus Binataceae bacterium]
MNWFRAKFRLAGAAAAVAALAAVSGCSSQNPAPEASKAATVAKAPPLGAHAPYAITAGLDGDLWFTEYQGDGIGRITPYGETKRFPIGEDSFAERIAAGPDGAIWFTDTTTNRIGRVDSEGKTTYVTLPHPNSAPVGITSGPDGNLWFTEHSGDRVGRLAMSASV